MKKINYCNILFHIDMDPINEIKENKKESHILNLSE